MNKSTNEKASYKEIEAQSAFRKYDDGPRGGGKHGCRKACCFTPVAIVVLLIIAVVIACAVVVNKTPNELGFGDYEFAEGVSLDSLGLGDVKIKDMYKFLQNLAKEPDESEIVTNPITEEDAKEANGNVNKSSDAPKTADGELDYGKVLTGDEPLYYESEYLLRYADSNIAYMINTAVEQNSNAESSDSSVESLKELNANIVEVDIIKESDGTYTLKVICAMDLAPVKSEIEKSLSELGGVADYLIDLLPSRIYLISYNTIAVDADGKITTTSKGMGINNISNATLVDVVIEAVEEFVYEDASDSDGAINDAIGKLFNKAIGNLGKVGIADVDENGLVVSNIKYGTNGLGDGYLEVITYTKGE